MAVDEGRVVAHFDIDCFYAQSEELRCPSLRGRPVGVTQKFLVVTSNYVARGMGVPKMVSIAEAKRVLPSLVLVNGEDLTPYRADSKLVMAVLSRFGILERHGFDEGAVDITAQVLTRVRSATRPGIRFQGHVLGLPGAIEDGKGVWIDFGMQGLDWEGLSFEEVKVLVGGQVVAEMRAALESETGFRCSCGVAQNKMLAKLASSLNKPSKQTCLLGGAVLGFLAPLSVRKIPGVGKQMHGGLLELGVETMADLGKLSISRLSEKFGARIGSFLFQAGMGRDPTPVLDKGPPKSISVEDSFRNCKTMQRATEILRVLAPDLIRRLDEDAEETGRRPKTLTLKWRVYGSTWNFSSTSQKTPPEVLCTSVAVEKRAFALAELMSKLLARSVQAPFDLVVLNIGATNFVDSASADLSPGGRDIRSFLNGSRERSHRELKVVSKSEARAQRESFKPMVARRSLAGPMAGIAAPKRKLKDLDNMNILSEEAEGEFFNSNSSSENEAEEWDDILMDEVGLTFERHYQRKRMKATESEMRGSGRRYSLEQGFSISKRCSPKPNNTGACGLTPEWEASFSRELDDGVAAGSGMVRSSEPSSSAKGLSASHSADVMIQVAEEGSNTLHAHKEFSLSGAADAEPSAPVGTLSRELRCDSSTEEHRGPDTDPPPPLYTEGRSWRSSSIVNTDSSAMRNENDGDFSTHMMRNEASSLGTAQPMTHWTCEKCGELLEDSANVRQEHADFHFALSLDCAEEANLLPKKTVASARKGQTVCQRRGPKSRSGTLDKFIVRLG